MPKSRKRSDVMNTSARFWESSSGARSPAPTCLLSIFSLVCSLVRDRVRVRCISRPRVCDRRNIRAAGAAVARLILRASEQTDRNDEHTRKSDPHRPGLYQRSPVLPMPVYEHTRRRSRTRAASMRAKGGTHIDARRSRARSADRSTFTPTRSRSLIDPRFHAHANASRSTIGAPIVRVGRTRRRGNVDRRASASALASAWIDCAARTWSVSVGVSA